ncbi:MAG: acetyltransferase [Rhodothermales bacterium]|nr:acetyltransferase [Rhodothermales bacterium]
MRKVVLIGCSGHAYVVAEILNRLGRLLAGYCDLEPRPGNYLGIPFLGHEISEEGLEHLRDNDYFVAIGDNYRRQQVTESLAERGVSVPLSIRHPDAVVSSSVDIGAGSMVGPSSMINPFVRIGDGVICNTGCIVEHECVVGDFAHIAPGAVLAGNVRVGEFSFVGANAVVKEGLNIGANCVIGAGSVIIRNLPDGAKVVGNPGRIL